jgi:hypothetical protein
VARSAGKKDSSAISDRVTSTGVPNTVVVLRNDRTPASVASCSVTVAPTALGYAFVIFQAAVVAAFAGLQVAGLRREAVTA